MTKIKTFFVTNPVGTWIPIFYVLVIIFCLKDLSTIVHSVINGFYANNIVSVLFFFPEFLFFPDNCIVFDAAVICFVTQRATNIAWQPTDGNPVHTSNRGKGSIFFFLSTKWMQPKEKKNGLLEELLGNAHEWLTFGFSLQYYYNVNWTGDEKKKEDNDLLLKVYCHIAQPKSQTLTLSEQRYCWVASEKKLTLRYISTWNLISALASKWN